MRPFVLHSTLPRAFWPCAARMRCPVSPLVDFYGDCNNDDCIHCLEYGCWRASEW